ELATLFNERHGIGADLRVMRAEGWQRHQWQDQAGLPWVNPSPNLRSLDALINYPGTVYFEGTNLSEGRGTDRPFEQAGAPWLDAPRLVRTANGWNLSGVRFAAVTLDIAPEAMKFPGQTVPGVRFVIDDRQAYRPVRTALLVIDEIRRQHPGQFAWSGTLDRLAGTDKVRLAIEDGTLPAVLDAWDREAAAFARDRAPFLLY